MNFTTDPNSVRAELFKPSGKWYMTVALSLINGLYDDWDMWTNYRKAFEDYNNGPLGSGWMLVILDPYNKNTHPIMLIGDGNAS